MTRKLTTYELDFLIALCDGQPYPYGDLPVWTRDRRTMIARCIERGWVERINTTGVFARRRRYLYSITPAGAAALAADLADGPATTRPNEDAA